MTDRTDFHHDLDIYAGVAVMTLHAERYLSDCQVDFIGALRKALEAASEPYVIVDISRAVMLSSGPIGAMVLLHRQASRDGGAIVAAGGGDFAVKVLKFAANIIQHKDDVATALAGISDAALADYERKHGR